MPQEGEEAAFLGHDHAFGNTGLRLTDGGAALTLAM
jgi:hypothetical protein